MKTTIERFISIILLATLLSCSNKETTDQTAKEEPNVVEVSAIYDAENDLHLFQAEADTIAAGWTTFRFINRSPMVHFLFFDLLPEGKNSEDLLSEVSPVFQESSYLIMEGKNEEAMAKFAELPAWFNKIVFWGGAGFVSPGKTTETTLFMKSGNYVMECYIKTEDGTFHWKKGMHRDLHVSSDSTDVRPPSSPTIEITTTDNGLQVEGEPTPGKHLVAVHFNEDNPGLIARDVHVAQINEDSSIKEIATWMDFNNAKGMVSTSENPGPAIFVGGTHELPRGNKAYFTLDLEPGKYAWISEQPVNKTTIQEFTVEETE